MTADVRAFDDQHFTKAGDVGETFVMCQMGWDRLADDEPLGLAEQSLFRHVVAACQLIDLPRYDSVARAEDGVPPRRICSRRSRSTGFVRCSSNPAPSAASTSASCPYPLSATSRVRLNAGL